MCGTPRHLRSPNAAIAAVSDEGSTPAQAGFVVAAAEGGIPRLVAVLVLAVACPMHRLSWANRGTAPAYDNWQVIYRSVFCAAGRSSQLPPHTRSGTNDWARQDTVAVRDCWRDLACGRSGFKRSSYWPRNVFATSCAVAGYRAPTAHCSPRVIARPQRCHGRVLACRCPCFAKRLEHHPRELLHLGQIEQGGVVTGKTIHRQRPFVKHVPTQQVFLHIGCGAVGHEQVHRHLVPGC